MKTPDNNSDEWPIVKYNKPYRIVQQDWVPKNLVKRQEEILDRDEGPTFYEGPFNPAGDIQWEKQPDFFAEFEPNQVNMFRVILEQRSDANEEVKEEVTGGEISKFYSLHLEKLKIARMSQKMMSSHQLYLIQTPVNLYIWLGSQLESLKRNGSLRILQSFSKHILDEAFSYKPGYYY